MARKKKEETEEAEVKKTKKSDAVEAKTETSDGVLPKIQCFNENKKLICANLLLESHKCTVKTIANGRLASVRIGKKRRCEMYEETAYSA